ncbi:CPBP family intramembrane glutamic endopeptidase [Yoonia sp. R2-816]|uniref:CPBP family intramembrane glutamic endopeptidase n=1 Tax=Yoonia sp. R2-816 TaxID=3342638 RepID=UPI0037288B44
MRQTVFAEPFEQFIAPARRKPAVWRIIVGFVLIAAVYIGVVAAALGTLSFLDEFDPESGAASLGFLLATFSGATLGVWAAVKWLHGRSFGTVIGPLRPALRHFGVAVIVVFAVQAVLLVIWSVPFDAVFQRSLGSVLILLPLVIVLTLIQTSAEEFVFRGYLMQQMAARFQSPWVWLLVPQAAFALLHYDPATMGALTWPVIAIIFVYALMWADLVRVTGNLGAACGWHFANNMILFAFVSPQDAMSDFAWAVAPYAAADTPVFLFVLDFLASVVCWRILRHRLRP